MKSIIAFANQKGGLGKTACAVMTARCLVEEHRKKVLFLDLDVQGNASFTLANYKTAISVSDFLKKDLKEDELNSFKEVSLALLYATEDLANDQGFIIKECLNHFNNNLSLIKKHFDYVIIDTPPTLGNKLFLSLMLTQQVVIPIEPESFALQGLQKLFTTINSVKEANKELNLLGVVINKLQSNRPRQMANVEKIKQSPLKEVLFKTVIKYRDCVSDALSNGISLKDLRKIRGYNSRTFSSAQKEFKGLTDEIIRRAR